jgi:hypothetical protein
MLQTTFLLGGLAAATSSSVRAPPPRTNVPRDSSTPELQTCAQRPDMQWVLAPNGTLSSASAGLCLSAASWPPVDQMPLVMRQCSPTADPTQQWDFVAPPSNVTLRLASAPTFCANVAGYGASPGAQIWIYTCDESDCKGNCLWEQRASPDGSELVNPLSGLCFSDGDVPLVPQTCAPGSPSFGAAYCNSSLPFSARVDALWNAMSPEERLYFFSIPIRVSQCRVVCACLSINAIKACLIMQPNDYNSVLNIKSFYWDITGIAGRNKGYKGLPFVI